MKLNLAIKLLQSLAPESLAESWDKVGLHVGDPDRDVDKALLCIDLTEAVLDEAIASKANLIVAYHPPIFAPLTAVTTGDTKQRIVMRAIEAGIAIYSPHTALDAAADGTTEFLAEIIGQGSMRPIHPTNADGASYKIVVFVPADKADALRDALANAGASVIGDYTRCTFASPGQGTFQGGETTNPTIGQRGRTEHVDELRLETVCAANRLAAAMAALREAHPYEEPAVDIYKLAADPTDLKAAPAKTGAGRVLTLDKPMTIGDLVHRVKRGLLIESIEVAPAPDQREIKTVGLCPGAGGSLLADAGPIDAYLTGEMRHHDVLAAVDRGTTILLAGHTQTERPYLQHYAKRLAAAEVENAAGADIEWHVSKADRALSNMR